jgi:hypothetical protein
LFVCLLALAALLLMLLLLPAAASFPNLFMPAFTIILTPTHQPTLHNNST